MDDRSTRETSRVQSIARTLSEFIVAPFLLAHSIGDRYRTAKKHEIAIASFRAGMELGRLLERKDHGECACQLLPPVQGEEQSDRPLREGSPEAE